MIFIQGLKKDFFLFILHIGGNEKGRGLMSKTLMKGFLVKDVSSVQDLEAALYNIQESVQQTACKAYESLVKWQVERQGKAL